MPPSLSDRARRTSGRGGAGADGPQKLRDRLLGEFAPDVAAALIEFANAISEIDADVLIFMARKALRLHDLLMLAGCKPTKRIILSSHVLDQNLEVFRGKRVALIDDTLILGSTLGSAIRRLREAGVASVSSYVFAIDRENWCHDLAEPDRSFLLLNHDAMLTFCANEVEALAVSGIPYLADFPVSRIVKFTRSRLDMMHAMQTWSVYPLTSARQDAAGTLSFSLLPTPETRADLEADLGPFASLMDIAKIRAFAQSNDGQYWVRFLPLLTLRPIRLAHLDRLWAVLLQHAEFDARQLGLLERHVSTPKARLRMLQYYASLLLGRAFSRALQAAVALPRPLTFDKTEATRLFGPWLRSVIDVMHDDDGPPGRIKGLAPTVVPEEVAAVSRQELQAVPRSHDSATRPEQRARNVFTDLTRAFVQLHRDHELPARVEAHRLGRRIFTADAEEAPHRDRLEYGYAWSALVDCMVQNEGVQRTPERAMRLSLLLDVLIDTGIAVPVLCERDGVLFRAYRHGEDVAFTDQEFALAYDVMAGYLDGSGAPTITKLVCEKLLVSLLRVGAAKNFLSVVHGIGGGERVARVGFHLHGAVPFIPFDDTIYAEDHDSWFSTYLVQDGVLTKADKAGYGLGQRPEAAVVRLSAQSEATQLGLLLGRLMAARTADGRPVLDESGLILLTSCTQPKDAASAVVAELRLFLRWYAKAESALSGRGRYGEESLDWSSERSIRRTLQTFVSGVGYVALHSARLKTTGFHNEQAIAVYNRCADYLDALEKPMGAFFASHWRGAWGPLVEGGNLDQKQVFGELLRLMEHELFNMALGAFSIELALLSGEAVVTARPAKNAKYARACAKALSFLQELRPRVSPDTKAERLYTRLTDLAASQTFMQDPADACRYGMKFISDRRALMSALVRQAKDNIAEYGRTDPATYFGLSLWYDVVDSTGQRSGLRGDELRLYRNRIREFKRRVNDELAALIRDAARQNCNIYAWNAALGSNDDEKNVYFAGRRAMALMSQVSELILRSAKHHGLRLRMLLINGDFAGVRPHKFSREVYVEGEGYWESVARLKAGLKVLESSLGAPQAGESVVWGAQEVVDHMGNFTHLHWRRPPQRQSVTVEIENYPLEIQVVGGICSV